MDNILKLTVGCLGLVGLIVMVVPNSDPLAATKAQAEGATPIVGAGAPAPPPTTAAPEVQAAPSEFVVDDYDIGNFGQPMIDPTPPADRNIIAQQQQMQQQQQQALGTNNNQTAEQPPIAGADSAGPAGPPPPPPLPGN